MADPAWTWTHLIDIGVGAMLAVGGGLVQHLFAIKARREEREEDRLRLEGDRIDAIYARMLAVASEYQSLRTVRGATVTGAEWQPYLDRFHVVKAELALHGSDEVRVAFRAYLDTVVQISNTPGAALDRIDVAYETLVTVTNLDKSMRFLRGDDLGLDLLVEPREPKSPGVA